MDDYLQDGRLSRLPVGSQGQNVPFEAGLRFTEEEICGMGHNNLIFFIQERCR